MSWTSEAAIVVLPSLGRADVMPIIRLEVLSGLRSIASLIERTDTAKRDRGHIDDGLVTAERVETIRRKSLNDADSGSEYAGGDNHQITLWRKWIITPKLSPSAGLLCDLPMNGASVPSVCTYFSEASGVRSRPLLVSSGD